MVVRVVNDNLSIISGTVIAITLFIDYLYRDKNHLGHYQYHDTLILLVIVLPERRKRYFFGVRKNAPLPLLGLTRKSGRMISQSRSPTGMRFKNEGGQEQNFQTECVTKTISIVFAC